VTWTIESVREAAVGPSAVWALYMDPSTWSQWGHNATWARANGPLVDGGIVDVRANYGTVYHCRIQRLEPGRALEIVVRPAFLTISEEYILINQVWVATANTELAGFAVRRQSAPRTMRWPPRKPGPSRDGR